MNEKKALYYLGAEIYSFIKHKVYFHIIKKNTYNYIVYYRQKSISQKKH